MAALEDLGYLEHPHTSSGRVPTAAGYRLYVDELMKRYRLNVKEMETINQIMLQKIRDLDDLLAVGGQLVSELTGYTAFSSSQTERGTTHKFLHVEGFLTDPRSLVLVVARDGNQVVTRLVHLPRAAGGEEIMKVIQAVNSVYAGQSAMTEEMAIVCEKMCGSSSIFLPYALDLMQQMLKSRDEVYLTGETNLLEYPEFQELKQARKTLDFLSDRQRLLSLIQEKSVHGPPERIQDSIRILIGPENVQDELRETSVMMATYPMSDGMRGMIGVIGPTRMNYSRLESRLRYVARKIGILLESQEEDS
jgi:heat-inducible transcriptional repressor